jgi:TonB-linked SusC/RagA family outer membrane protein
MRMRPSRLSFLSVVLAVGAADAAAQQRQITGRVTAATTGDAVVGASVSVVGTAIATATGSDGRFTVAAPEGNVTLLVRRIGYKRRSVPVLAAQGSVDVSLEPDVFNLEAIVVTGQATGVERRFAPNAIATVGAAELSRAPAPTVETSIQGKVPGALIQQNSGAPGGGIQVKLRGVSTLNGLSAPLYVVDGVIMSDVAITNNQEVVTLSNAGSNPSPLQQSQVNRIADLNPNDIENVEVLKGASAAAIYGSKAANGVVVITTKRGQSGEARYNVTQRLGFFELAHKLGTRVFRDSAEAVTVLADSLLAGQICDPTCPNFDHEQELAGERDLSYESAVDVGGGGENTRYYFSGLAKKDAGIIQNTGFWKQSIRANIDQRLSDRLDVSLRTSFVHSLARRGLTNNDNANVSYYMALPFAPSFIDLRPANAVYPNNPIPSGTNPLQTAALVDPNDDDVDRFVGSLKLSFDVLRLDQHRVQLIGVGGIDRFTQTSTLFFPPELQFQQVSPLPGVSLLTNAENRNANWNVNLVYAYRPASGSFVATTSGGVQYEGRELGIARIVSRNLTAGQQNVGAGTSVSVSQRRERERDYGFYAQEELLTMQERLFLTAGVRGDRSSNNGDVDKYFFYPKAAASYRLPAGVGPFGDVKFRLAWGQSGNQPLYGMKYQSVDATQNIAGVPGLVAPATVGDPTIKPERQTEIEGGIDATMASGRANFEVTVYQKSVSDLLLLRTLAGSSGFRSQFFNGGKLRDRGIEVAIGVVPIQRADASLLLRSIFFSNSSRIVELPVPAFGLTAPSGGFGTNIGQFFIEEGKSATQIWGNVPDASPAGFHAERIGDANPDFLWSFVGDLTVRRFNLYALAEWQYGAELINLTKFIYDLGGTTWDCPTTCSQRLALFGRDTRATFLESATYFKLREVTLSYTLPVSAYEWTGARDARVSVSGRNLVVVTGDNYTGMDPEVSNFGNQPVARNIEVAAYPRSRSVWFTLSVGF